MAKKKYIESPEKLEDIFNQYVEWAEANPIEKTVKGNKGFVISDEKLKRPLTLEGFENFCYDKGFINDLGDYFSNKDNRYAEYATICRLIKRKIRQDQIEGGMVGIYKESITQRLNGLTEKIQEDGSKEVTIKVKYEKKGHDNTE